MSDLDLLLGNEEPKLPGSQIMGGLDFQYSNASLPYKSLIEAAEEKYGLLKNLFPRVIHQESRFNPQAVSPKGALGISQIMPQHHPGVNPWNVPEAIDYSAGLLRKHYDYFKDWKKAVASYNAGAKRVESGNYPAETVDFVTKVFGEPPDPTRQPTELSELELLTGPAPPPAPPKEQPVIQAPNPPGGWNEAGQPLNSSKIPYPFMFKPGKGVSNVAMISPLAGITSASALPKQVAEKNVGSNLFKGAVSLPMTAINTIAGFISWPVPLVAGLGTYLSYLTDGYDHDVAKQIADKTVAEISRYMPRLPNTETGRMQEEAISSFLGWPKAASQWVADVTGLKSIMPKIPGQTGQVVDYLTDVAGDFLSAGMALQMVGGAPKIVSKGAELLQSKTIARDLNTRGAEVKAVKESGGLSPEEIAKAAEAQKNIAETQAKLDAEALAKKEAIEAKKVAKKEQTELELLESQPMEQPLEQLVEPSPTVEPTVEPAPVEIPAKPMTGAERARAKKAAPLEPTIEEAPIELPAVDEATLTEMELLTKQTGLDLFGLGKKEPITDLDLQTGTPLPEALSTDKNPFRETDPEVTTKKNELYSGLKSVATKFDDLFNNPTKPYKSPETTTAKLINDINSWLDGNDKVDKAKTCDMLSEMAARADELKPEFSMDLDHKNWASTTSEAAVWARGADRAKIERTGEKVVNITEMSAKKFAEKYPSADLESVKDVWDRGGIVVEWDPSKPDIPMKIVESPEVRRGRIKLVEKKTPEPGTTRLNIAIPLDEIPDMVRKLIHTLKLSAPRIEDLGGRYRVHFDDLYRNKEIFDKTGYWLGKDNMWRFELDDTKLKAFHGDILSGKPVPLNSVITYPDLFEAVPWLKDTKIKLDPSLSPQRGEYNPITKTITLKHPSKDILVHELQHAVNSIQGSIFKGSNPSFEEVKMRQQFYDKLFEIVKDPKIREQISEFAIDHSIENVAEEIARIVPPELHESIGKALDSYLRSNAFDEYLKNSGEMESRVAARRLDMTAKQRAATPPWETLEMMLVNEGLQSVENVPGGIGTKLYSGIPVDQIKKMMKLWHGAKRGIQFLQPLETAPFRTGEGGMARGAGLYVSEEQGVGKKYAETLGSFQNVKLNNTKLDEYSHNIIPQPLAADIRGMLHNGGLRLEKGKEKTNLIDYLESNKDRIPFVEPSKVDDVIRFIKKSTVTATDSTRYLHEIEVPVDAKWLDWDKPIGDTLTPEDIRAIEKKIPDNMLAFRSTGVIYNSIDNFINRGTYDLLPSTMERLRGWLYRAATTETKEGFDKIISEYLARAENGNMANSIHQADIPTVVEILKNVKPDDLRMAEKKLPDYMTGGDLYRLLDRVMQIEKGTPAGDIEASKFLRDLGFAGNKFAGVSGNAPYSNYVLFAPEKYAKITSMKLFSGTPDFKDMADALIKLGKSFTKAMEKDEQGGGIKFGDEYRKLKRAFVRSYGERSGNIRQDLINYSKLGERVMEKMYLQAGGHPMATEMFKQMKKETSAGLSRDLKKIYNRLTMAERMIDIGKYKTPQQYNFPPGKTPEESAVFKELFMKKSINGIRDLTPAEAYDLLHTNEDGTLGGRVGTYFNWQRKAVEYAYDKEFSGGGLITSKERDALIAHNYRRTELLEDIFDKSTQLNLGGKKITVNDSGIQRLQHGTKADIYNADSDMMALETFNRLISRAYRNRALEKLHELATTDPENPFARVKTSKEVKIPPEFTVNVVKYYRDGKPINIFLSPDVAREWISSNAETTMRYAQTVRYLSAAPLVRTFATGTSWAFALRNLPRDIMQIWFTARIMRDKPHPIFGKYESVYSPIMPVAAIQMTKDMASTFRDAVLRKGRYQDYIYDGGGQDLLTTQGRIMQRKIRFDFKERKIKITNRDLDSAVSKFQDFMGYPGTTSEIVTRLMTRDRVIEKRAREKGITYEEAAKDKEIREEATFAALDYMNFHQGGNIVKSFDNAFPYLNARIVAARGFIRALFKDQPVVTMGKLAQFAALATGIYIGNKFLNPETMAALENDQRVTGNLVFPLGDSFAIIDSRGHKRYPFITLPIDQGMAPFKAMFEVGSDIWLGNPAKPKRILDAIGQLSPVDIGMLPPSVSGLYGYEFNQNFWTGKDIREEGKIFKYQTPKWFTGKELGGSEEEYMPGKTPQAMIDLGAATGLSPERMKYLVGQMITNDNMFAQLLGVPYNRMFSQLPTVERDVSWTEALANTYGIRAFFKLTNPYTANVQIIDENKERGEVRIYSENRGLDVRVNGYLYDGNYSRHDVERYINKFKDEETQDRLRSRFDFRVATKGLDVFWTDLKSIPDTESRARAYIEKMGSVGPEEYARLRHEQGKIEDIGGVLTEGFWDKVSQIRRGR